MEHLAAVRRSAVPVREHGQRQAVKEGPPKSGKPRVVSTDPATVALLKAHKRERGSLALSLARDDALGSAASKAATTVPST